MAALYSIVGKALISQAASPTTDGPRLSALVSRVRNGRGRSGPSRIALLLVFAGLAWAGGSAALTLGNLEVRSALGEPFSGIISIDPSAGEVIRRECFSAGAAFAAMPGVPVISDLRLALDPSGPRPLLRVASRSPVREPLAQVLLQVRCPGLPNITRSFVVILDPAPLAATRPSPVVQAPPARVSPRARAEGNPIAPGSNYVVQVGDTLSGIAARIAGRPPWSVWPLAARIRELNPGAFDDGRPESLRAGASLRIPDLDGQAATGVATDLLIGTRRTSPSALSERPERPVPGVAPSASPAADSATRTTVPVISATPFDPALQGGTELEYLALTPTLSRVSLERLRTRASLAEATPAQGPGPEPAPIPDTSVAEVPVAGPWYSSWWMLLLIPLLAALVVTAYFLRRRRVNIESEWDETSPWEVEESEDLEPQLPPGVVFDDFDGTFVPLGESRADAAASANAGAESAADPEDQVQTNLMPAVSAEMLEEGAAAEELRVDVPAGAADASPRKAPVRARETGSEIDVEPLEQETASPEEDGWIELDFEATQILEQDYLAEYAATLKNRTSQQEEPPAAEAGNADDDVLLEASELMEVLDEAPDSDRLELVDYAGDETLESLGTEDVVELTLEAPGLDEPAEADQEQTTQVEELDSGSASDEEKTSRLPPLVESGEGEDDTAQIPAEDNVITLEPGKKDGEKGKAGPDGKDDQQARGKKP